MAKVTVTSLPGLTSFSNRLEHLSSTYRDAIGKAGRDLYAKAREDNNQGEAIVAYLEKVNALQSQIFEKYPGDIAYFSKIVEQYVNSLKGMGFQQKAWSWHLGADDVKKALQIDQIDAITTYIDQFQSAFDVVTEALNEERIDLTSIQEIAETSFMEYGNQRKQLDNEVSKSYLDFVSLLQDVKNRFASIHPIIQACLYLDTLPIGSVISAIKAGRMSKDDMSMIEAIQQKGDGAMIEALISANPYTNLGNVNPEHVSDATMALVYNKIYEGTFGTEKKDGKISALEDFLVAVTKNDHSIVKNYMKKLLFASDKNALMLRTKGGKLLPKFKKEGATIEDMLSYLKGLDEHRKDFNRIDKNLTQAGQMASLFESIYGNNLGTENLSHYDKLDIDNIKRTFVKGSLVLTNQGFDYSFKVIDYETKTHSSTTTLLKGAKTVETSNALAEIAELKKERDKAIETFILDVGKTISILTSPYSTGAMVTLNIINDLIQKDQSKLNNNIDTASSLRYLTSDPIKSNIGGGANMASSLIKANSSYLDLTEKIKDAKGTAKKTLFGNVGIRFETDDETQMSHYVPEYDLRSALLIEDMNQNGLKGHVFRQTYKDTKDISKSIYEMNSFDSAVKNSKRFNSQQSKKYFLGKYGISMADLDIDKELFSGYIAIGDNNTVRNYSVENSDGKDIYFNSAEIIENQGAIFDRIINGNY